MKIYVCLEIQKRISEAAEDSRTLVERVRQEVETVLDQIIDFCFGTFEDLSR